MMVYLCYYIADVVLVEAESSECALKKARDYFTNKYKDGVLRLKDDNHVQCIEMSKVDKFHVKNEKYPERIDYICFSFEYSDFVITGVEEKSEELVKFLYNLFLYTKGIDIQEDMMRGFWCKKVSELERLP